MEKLTLSQFFRYAYGGLLSFFIATIIHPSFVKQIVESLGPIMSPLVVLAVGSGVYVFNRFIIVSSIDFIHLRYHPEEKCVFNYLRDKWGTEDQEDRINAFRVIRDSDLLNDKVKDILEIRHAEIHIVYLTFTLCLATVIYLPFLHTPTTLRDVTLIRIFGIIGILSIFFGVLNDLMLCREERFRIGIISEEKPDEIKKLLKDINKKSKK